jgi:hypothetical protein
LEEEIRDGERGAARWMDSLGRQGAAEAEGRGREGKGREGRWGFRDLEGRGGVELRAAALLTGSHSSDRVHGMAGYAFSACEPACLPVAEMLKSLFSVSVSVPNNISVII